MPGSKGFFAGSTLQQAPPPRTLPQCGACGLAKACSKGAKQPVRGGGARRVLFVGAAPTRDGAARGEAYSGRAAERLRRELRSLKFDLEDDAWHTNAIICPTPKDRVPNGAEVGYCRPNLARNIRELRPDIIIPMGQQAVAAVVGQVWREDVGQMGRWAGWRIPSQDLNAWVCPTWHPDQVLRDDDPVLDRQFRNHLAGALACPGRPWPAGPPTWAADVRRECDPARAAAWLRKAAQRQHGAIAWDYETNMLKPDGPEARIVSCSVAWGREEPERCIAFPWVGEAVQAMGELLRSPVPKIASNLKFEDRWTRKEFGHRVRGWVWDTMLAAHVCDNRPGITSVKFQAFARLGVPVWNDKVEPFLKTRGDDTVNAILREIEINDLLTYNGLDSLVEFRVATDQCRELGYPLPWST